MGMFDSVLVPCPKCKKYELFQSKGGACMMAVYKFEDVPPDVLSDINRHSPYRCHLCDTYFAVKVSAKGKAKSVKVKPTGEEKKRCERTEV